MSNTQKITPKEKIAEQLYENTTPAFPSSLIVEILSRLADERVSTQTSVSGFNHDEHNLFEACGIDKKYVEEAINYMQKKHEEFDKLSQVIEAMTTKFSDPKLAWSCAVQMLAKLQQVHQMQHLKSSMGDIESLMQELFKRFK